MELLWLAAGTIIAGGLRLHGMVLGVEHGPRHGLSPAWP